MPNSPPGSPAWQTLLEHAVALLRTVPAPGGRPVVWSLGGGTVLMFHYAHRTSRDIDVFLKDPQLLPYLSPRLNEHAAALTRDYVEAEIALLPGGERYLQDAPAVVAAFVESLPGGT